jgi:uncharacterized peroxidase-related enzyme
MTHHALGLSRLIRRRPDAKAFIKGLKSDHAALDLDPRQRALLDYAAKLTRTPWDMAPSDLDPLRNAGLTDVDILDANLTVAYFAYVNRLAQGLGAEVEPYVTTLLSEGKRPTST